MPTDISRQFSRRLTASGSGRDSSSAKRIMPRQQERTIAGKAGYVVGVQRAEHAQIVRRGQPEEHNIGALAAEGVRSHLLVEREERLLHVGGTERQRERSTAGAEVGSVAQGQFLVDRIPEGPGVDKRQDLREPAEGGRAGRIQGPAGRSAHRAPRDGFAVPARFDASGSCNRRGGRRRAAVDRGHQQAHQQADNGAGDEQLDDGKGTAACRATRGGDANIRVHGAAASMRAVGGYRWQDAVLLAADKPYPERAAGSIPLPQALVTRRCGVAR